MRLKTALKSGIMGLRQAIPGFSRWGSLWIILID
jgi:hypothetical protein